MNKLLSVLPVALLAACASPTPNYDTRFGDAVREARARQTLNPNAAGAPVLTGMDARSARDAITLYGKTFQAPPPVVNVINIGGAVGGQ